MNSPAPEAGTAEPFRLFDRYVGFLEYDEKEQLLGALAKDGFSRTIGILRAPMIVWYAELSGGRALTPAGPMEWDEYRRYTEDAVRTTESLSGGVEWGVIRGLDCVPSSGGASTSRTGEAHSAESGPATGRNGAFRVLDRYLRYLDGAEKGRFFLSLREKGLTQTLRTLRAPRIAWNPEIREGKAIIPSGPMELADYRRLGEDCLRDTAGLVRMVGGIYPPTSAPAR